MLTKYLLKTNDIFSKIVLPLEKKILVIEKICWKFSADGHEFANVKHQQNNLFEL